MTLEKADAEQARADALEEYLSDPEGLFFLVHSEELYDDGDELCLPQGLFHHRDYDHYLGSLFTELAAEALHERVEEARATGLLCD